MQSIATPARSPQVGPRGIRTSRTTWLVLWILLSILHVTQAIWLNAGRAYPGDLGDGRFNQLILEHGYQSLRGVYTWSSPSQFYPAANTLGFSDTHVGTLPIYAALRLVGFSLDRAWQAWFIVVAALNALAVLHFFSALGITKSLRGPFLFAATASVPMVWLAGTHMQMLPFFPLVLAWAELAQWNQDRVHARLLTAAGWFAWQFAAGPYLAFFGGVITLFVGLAWWLISPATKRTALSAGSSATLWIRSIVIALIGGGLALAAAKIYVSSVQSGAGRPMREVVDLAPTLRSWFTAPPPSLYPVGWPGGDHQLVERAWFAGFLPLALLLSALFAGWRNRRDAQAATMAALAIGALATLAFFTRWNETRGIWVVVTEWIEPLRAFRASGRVGGIVLVAELAAGGLLLSRWQGALSTSRWRFLPAITAVLLCVENIAHHQPATLLAAAGARAQALITAWKSSGNKPILVFAPGPTNQPDSYIQLDAWSAALRLHRATLNGYSGGMPGSHQAFLWNSTPKNASAVISASGIPSDQVSIVESFGAEADKRLGLVKYAQRHLRRLEGFELQPISAQLFSPLETFIIDGTPMYQFTPAAELKFALPDTVKWITYLVGLREDAYADGGKTDGAGVTWSLQISGEPETQLSYELLDPLNHPEHRGMLRRELTIPSGHDRILILRTDTGPAHQLYWDFLLFGALKAE